MNKKLSITLLAASTLLLSSTALALSDIANHKNQTAIQYLYDKQVIKGYEDGTFQPERVLNRAELLKILVGGANIQPDKTQYNNCFPDVQNQWFAPSICYAKEQKWVQGYEDGTFQPAKKVNRVEAIKMLVNSQGYEVPEIVTEQLFADADSTQWYGPFLKVAKDRDLLEETSGNFDIGGFMTRGSISENIYRAMIIKENSLSKFSEFTKQTDAASNNNTYYKVIKVVDGDTVTVEIDGQKETLRLIGIDTPETVHPSKPIQCFGLEASNKAKEILDGQEVALEADETQSERDKYDRLLRYIILKDGTNFNKLMIEQGYAHEYTYNSNPYKYQSEFQQAEKEAQEKELGLWSSKTCNGDTDQTAEQTQEEEKEDTQNNFDTGMCSANTYNCSNFKTQKEAQGLFDYCMAQVGIDIHKLDQDNNGDACESLP